MNQKIVPFYGDQLLATQDERGVWVSFATMTDALGLNTQAQWRRVQRSPWAKVAITATTAQDGRMRELPCLHLDSVPIWLATVETRRVKPEVREKLVRYQREAAEILARAFLRPEVSAPSCEVEDLRRRMAELEARQWHTVYAAMGSMQRDIEDLRRGQKQLRRGSRVSAMGRASGRDRKVKPREPKPLALALPGARP